MTDLAVEIATEFSQMEQAKGLTGQEFWAEVSRLEALGEDWLEEFYED